MEIGEQLNFIRSHEGEIKPLFSGDKYQALFKRKRYGRILREFETKLLTSSTRESGQHILITADEPLSRYTVQGLVREGLQDERISTVSVFISGIAAKEFATTEVSDSFKQISSERGILADLVDFTDRKPIDIVIGTFSNRHSPDLPFTYGARSCLGAKRLYYIFGAWGGMGTSFELNPQAKEPTDGIFCNDDVARQIIMSHLSNLSTERVLPLGTPVLESLEVGKAADYRQAGRAKLGIPEDALVMLYLGDVNDDYIGRYEVNKDINGDTFRSTLEAIRMLSDKHPDRHFAFLFRPHPRDPEKENLLQIAQQSSTGSNLSVIFAGAPMSMQEDAYIADVIMSLQSTENLLAPRRGRLGVYLGYKDKRLGADLLRQSYGSKIIQIIREQPGIAVVNSPENLIKVLEGQLLSFRSALVLPQPEITNYSRRILDYMLTS